MSDGQRQDVRSYVIGYVGALVLTAVAFALVHWPRFAAPGTFAAIIALALMQAIVHFRFFLHVSPKRGRRDHLLLLLFSTVIVALMASGTIVILANLRDRMM